MQIVPFCFFERSFYLIPRDEQDKSMFVKLVPHTHKQAIFKMPLVSVGTAQFFFTDRSSSPPQSGGWMVVFTIISARHTQGASPWGCLQDKATALHSGWMCSFGERCGGGCQSFENITAYIIHSEWSTSRSSTEMDIRLGEIKNFSCLSFLWGRIENVVQRPVSQGLRYKYFTYKYLYQLCSISFAWRNTLLSDLCLSLRFPSLQSIIIIKCFRAHWILLDL